MTPIERLKGCPFCGSNRLEVVETKMAPAAAYVRCWNCHATGPTVFTGESFPSPQLAAARWNNERWWAGLGFMTPDELERLADAVIGEMEKRKKGAA